MIRAGRSDYYVTKIENADSIEKIDKIERMINEDIGDNPDTLSLDFYDPLIDLVYEKRAKLEKMAR